MVKHEDTEFYWVRLVDMQSADFSALLRHNVVRLIEQGDVPILSSPCLSDQTPESNRCATVLKVKVIDGYVCGLLKPEGKKARVFRQMIRDQRKISLTVGGQGDYISTAEEVGRLSLTKIHYIRVEFIK